MRTILKKSLRLAMMVLIAAISPCIATVISTQWSDLTASVAASIESYAKKHNGELPPNLDHLYTDEHNAAIEAQLGGSLSEKIIYFRNTLPPLESTPGAKIVAAISFPINEDRRDSLGRYIIYQKPNGEMDSKWEREKVIQTSMQKANVALPDVAVYNERPLKVIDPDYAARLVSDAVKRYGLSLREATDKAEQHVQDVLNGRAKEAKNWDEVVTNQPSVVPPMTAPQATAMPLSTPRPAPSTSPHEAAHTESPAPSFPIVPVAIIVLVIIGVIVFLIRRK